MHTKTIFLATIASLCVSNLASAQSSSFDEGGKLYAVQNRKHVSSHEFTLSAGWVPLDAFYKGVTGSFSYAYHFSDALGWEIVHGTYSFNYNTSLRDDLETNFGVQPTDFPELRAIGSTNIVWKPLYGKLVYLNRRLLYGELYFVAGPALAQYENSTLHVGLNAGMGLRVFLNKSFSLRLEGRDYEFTRVSKLSDLRNEMVLSVGLGLNIR